MGCGMDTEIADKLCRAVSQATGVPMLPPVALRLLARTPALARHHRRAADHADRAGQQIGDGGAPQRCAQAVHRQHARDERGRLALRRWRCCVPEHDDLMVAV